MPKYKTGGGEILKTADVINSGGEGTVYKLLGRTDTVAKIYSAKNRTRERELKLQTMVKTPVLMDDYRYLTWPTNTLYEVSSGKFVGYTMPLSQAEAPLICCVNPVHRRKATALWAKGREKDLYTIAYDLALAFDICHRNNICIGDVNETNIMISPEGLPVIIDTDSFQVPNPNDPNKPFLCPVMTPDFTPPERTDNGNAPIGPEQDNFGLAVIIYRLLHNGIHPFVGIDRAGEISDIPNRIKAHRFAHSAYADNRWQPDKTSLKYWQKLSLRTQRLFMCALDYRKYKTNRPTAAEWRESLDSDIEESEKQHENSAPLNPYQFILQPAPRLKEEAYPYGPEARPSVDVGPGMCQCSKCMCQLTTEYEFCYHCAMNHEKTIANCQCQCLCEKIRKVKYEVCYDCHVGKHKPSILEYHARAAGLRSRLGNGMDDVDDLPF